jgi:hypothetical protein
MLNLNESDALFLHCNIALLWHPVDGTKVRRADRAAEQGLASVNGGHRTSLRVASLRIASPARPDSRAGD